ncbi:DHH family phosphoesterase [Patescibacteria group bacterium]|nr:DHH family phosphoesterase [Patescibacteria group bacterium]MBU4512139.1 DHH family phosphoesterase [Patescibacteria group bacterium]MCG2692504.1 DHH family phosphoesterase [Candidatus Parcubacteria bacterium]
MSLTPEQQIYNSIEKAKNILITFKQGHDIDSITAALAIAQVLKKLDKKYCIASYDFKLLPKLSFLAQTKEIKGVVPPLRKFIISLNISKSQVKELNYDVLGERLKIFITPQNGFFAPEDVLIENSNFIFDLTFVLNTQDLDALGKIYEDNTEFFYETPIINIDYHPNNEYFGQINLINLVATSTSEIVYSLIEALDKNLIDEDVATALLTGVISETKNFKSLEITPQTLITTSKLITLGGRREEIVENLYRTKTITDLKLWGRVLARLELSKKEPRLVSSSLTLQDFEKSGASKDTLLEVIDELIVNIPKAEIIILLYEEKEKDITVLVTSYNKNIDVFGLTSEFKPQGSKDKVRFSIKGKSVLEAEKWLIPKLEEKLKTS